MINVEALLITLISMAIAAKGLVTIFNIVYILPNRIV